MNIQSKYPEFSNRLNQVWKECVEAPSNQTHLSKWLGFAQPTVNNWINGNALPGLETAVNLANRFGCNPIWLITGKGNKGMNNVNASSLPILDKFNQLCPDQQREVTEFIDFKLSQKHANKPLTAQPENVGGGVNLPVQSQQSQDQRGLTKTRPNQFEIDLAIEHERCVMVRHQEQMEANARYIELVKEKCQNNECYCEPPCENVETPLLGYMQIIEAVKK